MISFFLLLKKKISKYKHLKNTFLFSIGQREFKRIFERTDPTRRFWGLTLLISIVLCRPQSEGLLSVHSLFSVKRKARSYQRLMSPSFVNNFLGKRRQISAAEAHKNKFTLNNSLVDNGKSAYMSVDMTYPGVVRIFLQWRTKAGLRIMGSKQIVC